MWVGSKLLHPYICTNSQEMFKHLLLKGLMDIMVIFVTIKPKDTLVIKACLKEANEKAAPLWRNQGTPFMTWVKQCREIVDPILLMNNLTNQEGNFEGILPELIGMLDEIFKKFYGTPDKLLLIRRTHDKAYEAQDGYSCEVVLLGNRNPWHGSQAMTCLSKMYERNSTPLLTLSSVLANVPVGFL